jgi:hypothetical protein
MIDSSENQNESANQHTYTAAALTGLLAGKSNLSDENLTFICGRAIFIAKKMIEIQKGLK